MWSKYYYCSKSLLHSCFSQNNDIFYICHFSFSPINYQPSPQTLVNIESLSPPPKNHKTHQQFCFSRVLNYFDLTNRNFATTSVRSNNCLSSGFKSRPRNWPFISVVRGNGVWVIKGREFPTAKLQAATKVNLYVASKVVVERADLMDVWGRPLFIWFVTVTSIKSLRGSKGGM